MKKFLVFLGLGVVFIGISFLISSYHNAVRPPEAKRLAIVTPTVTPTPSPLPQLKLPIVMFHYVENVEDPRDVKRIKMDVPPFILNLQLKALKDNEYDTYFVKDIPGILSSGRELKNKSIVLTFDDGYVDFYRNAFPLVKKYNLKATVYIIYNFIGRRGFMSLAQIHELIDSGLIEVGSHTMTHPSLEILHDEEAKKEIFESKKSLEETFGVSVTSFAYPAGAYNNETLKLVREAGYTIALTTHPGIIIKKDNLYEVPRIRPGSLTPTFIENYFEKFLFH